MACRGGRGEPDWRFQTKIAYARSTARLTRARSRVAVLPEDRIFEPSGVALFM
ncbi:hypothetical protein SAMN05216215_101748 [Saccharopolyspora shandongensis]|uniref:Uncharacterized protein n=1 Tax=Saccharopolyspora shandongensis TaxID=418495 RepID=A0A1H3FMA5_9PSEU|nr:hypothetical protein SAMN05216215_101748 [Saccharopolyspora shandongensis]